MSRTYQFHKGDKVQFHRATTSRDPKEHKVWTVEYVDEWSGMVFIVYGERHYKVPKERLIPESEVYVPIQDFKRGDVVTTRTTRTSTHLKFWEIEDVYDGSVYCRLLDGTRPLHRDFQPEQLVLKEVYLKWIS